MYILISFYKKKKKKKEKFFIRKNDEKMVPNMLRLDNSKLLFFSSQILKKYILVVNLTHIISDISRSIFY